MDDTAAIAVIADDLARVIDPIDNGVLFAQGIVDRGVGPVAVEEPVAETVAVIVIPDDLARGVDAVGIGAGERESGQGIVERGVGAVAVEEPVGEAAAIVVVPDDLARGVDAELPLLYRKPWSVDLLSS